MKYHIEEWTIEKLIGLYENNLLNLNPPYQRNEIWPVKAKQLLVESIKKQYPIPNIFLFNKTDIFEVVDGQQRIRSLVGFYKKLFKDLSKKYFDENDADYFLNYKLAVVIIDEISEDESIEEYYTLVNSAGLKINRPELLKSKYYDTRFLTLLDNISAMDELQNLKIFTEAAQNRMQDIDFIGELVSLLKLGIKDKKTGVDELFENDITQDEYENLFSEFKSLLKIVEKFDSIFPISETRYKQRNDFYTLFGFLHKNQDLDEETLIYFYKVLVLIGEDIYPSNEDCPPLKEYARNCVTQSNSKDARLKRINFFNELLLNSSNEINNVQKQILDFYGLDYNDTASISGYLTLSVNKIQQVVKEPFLTGE